MSRHVNRYYVSPCDEANGSGSKRGRSWDVVDRRRKAVVSNHDTRQAARREAWDLERASRREEDVES